ncbi:uncharacterized protein LOC111886192 [Lactuca sativa]|uniref:uncharacterized protein LOC111886192 n=1 Tax=Lactuca sativa TaxID=4236 RepID=UPI000CD83CC9|nr:uncharacterized protein LOC111886192 [Lactuca sativa]
MFCLFGDFNEVRVEEDRFGTMFHTQRAAAFNRFIDDAGLVEIQLGARQFTWMNNSGTKMSKLDKFLVSPNTMQIFPKLSAVVLERRWSDHNPILLHEYKVDYGPVPFRVFNSWDGIDGFNEVVATSWAVSQDNNADSLISKSKMRLKKLKLDLKALNNEVRLKEQTYKINLRSSIDELDNKIDGGIANEEKRNQRDDVLMQLDKIENRHAMDLAQKTKIKWDMDWDENSKFFNGMLKHSRRKQTIQG